MMKWSPEAVVGIVALGASTIGGVITTAVHWGATTTRFEQLEKSQTEVVAKLDAHQAELADQKLHESVVEQKLNDLGDQLNRIERKLK